MDNPALDLQGAEILIVDDVPDNVRLLSNTLSEQSYRVRGVTSGSMAVLEVIDQVMDLDRAGQESLEIEKDMGAVEVYKVDWGIELAAAGE